MQVSEGADKRVEDAADGKTHIGQWTAAFCPGAQCCPTESVDITQSHLKIKLKTNQDNPNA